MFSIRNRIEIATLIIGAPWGGGGSKKYYVPVDSHSPGKHVPERHTPFNPTFI